MHQRSFETRRICYVPHTLRIYTQSKCVVNMECHFAIISHYLDILATPTATSISSRIMFLRFQLIHFLNPIRHLVFQTRGCRKVLTTPAREAFSHNLWSIWLVFPFNHIMLHSQQFDLLHLPFVKYRMIIMFIDAMFPRDLPMLP